VNLVVLERIRDGYKFFREVYKFAKKTNLYEKIEVLNESRNTIEDLFIVEIFACLERFLRDKLKDCVDLEKCKFKQNIVLNNLEYMKIEDILDSLKGATDSNTIGFIKQIKRYRDWVAHGRNPEKPPPVIKIDFEKSFEVIKSIMEALV